MPRKPRLNVPGGLYHLILRGNARQAIFFDEEDRLRWESYLDEGLQRYKHRIHAYCWMTNHVHIAIQSHVEPLDRFMSFVASQYARSTNKKMRRSGHLFERRYFAILVQADSYLQELIRYIHLNPLRAAMVDDLQHYAWSSHPAYLGGPRPEWLYLDWVLSMFGNTEHHARRRYRNFMRHAQPETMAQLFREGAADDRRVLGDDGFRAAAIGKPDTSPRFRTLDELVRSICNKYGVTEAELAHKSRTRKHARIRADIGLLALEHGITSVTQVAHRFGRSQSALSRTMSQLHKENQ
jgi:putative transposase